MRILALDTSTRLASLALAGNEGLVAELRMEVRTGHAATLLPSLKHLLALSGWNIKDIELIACAVGPGSFAGLRIGIATVKGIALATGAQTVGVNTLRAMALPHAAGTRVICPVLDAKKDQVYAALFEGDKSGGLRRISEDLALFPAQLAERLKGRRVLMVGEGAVRYASLLREGIGKGALFDLGEIWYSVAGAVAAIGRDKAKNGDLDTTLIPNYIRSSDAEEKAAISERSHNGHSR